MKLWWDNSTRIKQRTPTIKKKKTSKARLKETGSIRQNTNGYLWRSFRRWLCIRTPLVCSIPPMMLLTPGTWWLPLITIFSPYSFSSSFSSSRCTSGWNTSSSSSSSGCNKCYSLPLLLPLLPLLLLLVIQLEKVDVSVATCWQFHQLFIGLQPTDRVQLVQWASSINRGGWTSRLIATQAPEPIRMDGNRAPTYQLTRINLISRRLATAFDSAPVSQLNLIETVNTSAGQINWNIDNKER